MQYWVHRIVTAVMVIAATSTVLAEDTAKPPNAARSVHLWLEAPPATLFYHEVVVEESQPGTYFCVGGFGHGYCGIQDKGGDPARPVVIFSVWEPGKTDDPKAVAADRRVRVTEHGAGVDVDRFGGEGTGAHCFLTYPWKVGETCRFLIRAAPSATDPARTAYTAWFFRNDDKAWKLLATFETIANGDLLGGLYCFVEDFRRDGKSPKERRAARFTNGWVKTQAGHWVSLTQAKFTADSTPLNTIDAGVIEDGFTLATGGSTTEHTDLNSRLTRLPAKLSLPDLSRGAVGEHDEKK